MADSFAGLPKPSEVDEGLGISRDVVPILAINRSRVEGLFRAYDLLDERVRFLEGWFAETLPRADFTQLALLRLDGRRSRQVLKPVTQREVMRYAVGRSEVSTRRACGVIKATRSSAYYRSRKDPLTALRQRLRELAQTRVRFGYRRLRVLLSR